MKCADCPHAMQGRVGDSCPLKKSLPNIATAFDGCNLATVKAEAKQAEKRRIESLPDAPVYPKGVRGEEKALQAACEGLLRQWGYRPSTAPEIVASVKPEATEVNGWYVHLNNCERNPLLPDLQIFNADMTRCLMVELKVVSVYQPGQLEFIKSKRWIECRDVAQFVEVVKALMNKNK